MNTQRIVTLVSLLALASLLSLPSQPSQAAQLPDDPSPPSQPVKLVFIHHSTGGNWLADPNPDQPAGGLARALMDNNYFVSATNYGWGPDAIGDRTDIPNWPEWFGGPDSAVYLEALYTESGQNIGDFGDWSRLPADPGGENEIIVFKSCFPNSDLYGSPDDPPASEPDNQYTVANAKAVYTKLLDYFASRPDKLFVAISAPPLMREETEPGRAANARAFNNWLVNDWLADYPLSNVAVFDYYNVLTSNGGDVDTNDAGAQGGNHHRWWNGAVQHVQSANNNFSAYPSGDSHPSTAGHQKATAEFVPLLNVFYNRWKAGAPLRPPPAQPTQAPPATPEPYAQPTPAEPTPGEVTPPAVGVIDDFESELEHYTEGEGATYSIVQDRDVVHGGAASLHFEYDVAPGGWGSLGRSFETQDWSGSTGLALWMRCEKEGQLFTLVVFSGDPMSPTPFDTLVESGPGCVDDWQPRVFAWGDFVKADWMGDEGLPELDLARIVGYGLSVWDADGSQNAGRLWLDDIGLASGEAAPPPLIAPAPTQTPGEEPTRPAEPGTPAPPPPTSAPPSGGGPCPSAALALALGLLLAAGISLRR